VRPGTTGQTFVLALSVLCPLSIKSTLIPHYGEQRPVTSRSSKFGFIQSGNSRLLLVFGLVGFGHQLVADDIAFSGASDLGRHAPARMIGLRHDRLK
jgi:hypothetical protein